MTGSSDLSTRQPAHARAHEPPELYGRGKILRFVTDALDRRRNRDTPPIMLLIGPRGSGKTMLTRHLEAWHRAGAPVCAIDLGLRPDATPTAVMWLIARELSRRVANVGKPRFPLLGIGLIAVNLDPASANSPEEQLRGKLHGGPLSGQQLTGLVAQAGTLLPPDQRAMANEAATVLGWIVDSYNRGRLNTYLAWYATLPELAGGDGSKLGPLLVLYRKWRDAVAHSDPGTSRKAELDVWRVLTLALLQDLRNGFDKGSLTHGPRTVNCLLLLDNADTTVGRKFLGTLAGCRGDLRSPPDPLLAISTQGTARPPHPSAGEPVAANDDRLSHANWLGAARDPDNPPSPFYPVLLTDLSQGDVRSEIKSHVLGGAWFDADYVHALTGGHPAAVSYLARRLEEAGTRPGGFDPRDLLTLDAEDYLLDMLCPARLNPRQLRAMAVFAATSRPRLRAVASVFHWIGLENANEMDIRDRFTDLIWVGIQPGAGTSPGTGTAPGGGDGLDLRPLPRLLLRRWLARDRATWDEVHNAYLTYYRSQDTYRSEHRETRERTAEEYQFLALEQYHLLALTTSITAGASGDSNLRTIATQFDEQLDRRDTAAWNASLALVTTAPNRLRGADEDRAAAGDDRHFKGDPEDVVKRLADVSLPGERQRTVTRLVAARWLYNDHSFDPSRRLARLLAEEYFDLARLTDGDSEVFYQEAERFREVARTWEESL